ncbi:MAG: DegT/DnrJ/EryC1/StrS aminotransferase family protein [Treponema sp.]|uniref:DegT/DnrJ/EryC1/StrS family aminotransferase n=1 Tax=Treponema sp. TaxID=166 RepID=UPI001B44F7E7|nr:DegT/DnrJ/EryC1/StrS family aminotransferase [Treponema sp.]MBP5401532.1 DegT/DnrJ/EryC1/StrS aminotransferase family protein [Treponema sp.]MBR5932916.1 DegT/DnrJ/EryC1/StrS aminotransferase family protein [Treponema sp.]
MIQTFSSTIRRREMDAVLTCMVDEKIGPGEINARFIQSVKEFFGCAGALALRSPDIGVKYALMACGIPEGSKIMISALAPYWQLFAVKQSGYEPLILDVDPLTSCVTPEIVEQGIKDGGRLLILHESLGVLPDIEGIIGLGIPVIEDVSQSAGAMIVEKEEGGDQNQKKNEEQNQEIKGKKAGSFGVFSICALEEHDIITSGGGAILMAPGRREWPVLKQLTENMPGIQMLPDINAALGLVQLKEYKRNEQVRKEIFNLYNRSIMVGKNKTFVRDLDYGSAAYSFPVILNSGFKDVKQYTSKKDIEIVSAFSDSVIGVLEKLKENLLEEEKLPYDCSACKNAKSLYLRTALFPLYPRLSRSQIDKIAKVLGTLP